jgi:hypothetical protein
MGKSSELIMCTFPTGGISPCGQGTPSIDYFYQLHRRIAHALGINVISFDCGIKGCHTLTLCQGHFSIVLF